jgi:hypothetical protein
MRTEIFKFSPKMDLGVIKVAFKSPGTLIRLKHMFKIVPDEYTVASDKIQLFFIPRKNI